MRAATAFACLFVTMLALTGHAHADEEWYSLRQLMPAVPYECSRMDGGVAGFLKTMRDAGAEYEVHDIESVDGRVVHTQIDVPSAGAQADAYRGQDRCEAAAKAANDRADAASKAASSADADRYK